MNKDEIKGKAKDVAGRVERQVGEWTGNPEKQAHGAMKQAEGKIQNAWGNVKDEANKATDRATNKRVEPAADSAETEKTESEDEDIDSRKKAS